MRSRRLIVACVGLLAGCHKATPAGAAASGSARAEPHASPAAPSASALPAAKLDEAAAKELIRRWEVAQNEHDFAAYSSLYAERFSGVKRVGKHVARFERKTWLRDRQPMFKDGVSVTVSELVLTVVKGSARAVFRQEFHAPGFQDAGKKQLFLIETPDGLRIAREEMLESNVRDTPASGASVLYAVRGSGVVLARGLGNASLKGAPRLTRRGQGGTFGASAALDEQQLSPEERAWVGKPVTVYDGASACTDCIDHLEARVVAIPHFGMAQGWEGQNGEPKASDVEIAASIWDIAGDERRDLVGVLAGSCTGQWASAMPLALVATAAPSAALRAAALSAFRELPDYLLLELRFREEAKDTAHSWEGVDGSLEVSELRAPGQPPLLVVSAQGGAGCGGFFGTLTAIWAVSSEAPTPKLALRGALDPGSVLHVRAALPTQSGLELLSGPDSYDDELSILRPDGATYSYDIRYAIAYWDCPC